MQAQTGTRGTVLIVEDSPDIVDVLILTLSKAGFAVIYADSRDKALELLLLHNEPDAILLDVYMRGLALDEFVKRARILYRDIRFVLISSGIDLEDVAKRNSITDFIRKPFLPEDLEAVVTNCVDRHRRNK